MDLDQPWPSQAVPGKAQSTSTLLARAVLREIQDRDMEPGDVLPSETDLARRFGVSKGSMREAIRILETHGVITVKSGAGGGPIVADPVSASGFARAATMFLQHGKVQISQLLEARVILEPFMARIAAERHSENASGLKELQQLQEFAQSMDITNDSQYRNATFRFHQIVGGITGNPVLDLFGRALYEVFSFCVPGSLVQGSKRGTVIEEHDRITEAIINRDGDTAERLMREHIEWFSRQLRRRYRDLMNDMVEWR